VQVRRRVIRKVDADGNTSELSNLRHPPDASAPTVAS
jgi:hypothetical protein